MSIDACSQVRAGAVVCAIMSPRRAVTSEPDIDRVFIVEEPAMRNPSRRAFLTTLGTAAAGPVILGRRAFAQNPPARVDATALRQRLDALSTFGRLPGGSFADGVSRIAYSDADLAGRRYVIDLMRAAGLDPRLDPAGNIFGRRAGTDQALPPILLVRTSIRCRTAATSTVIRDRSRRWVY